MSGDGNGPDPVLGDGPVTIGQDGLIHQGTPSGPAREGSRETYEGKIVSVPKDYCATPQGSSVVIIGYKIWAFQREATNLADTVLQTSLRSHVKGSIIKHCYGDEKGTLGGVCSGTHNGECTPKTWSETVTFGGRNAVRHNDEWWMNNRNTWGVLDYEKDTNQYPTDDPQQIEAKMQAISSKGDQIALADAPPEVDTNVEAPSAPTGSPGASDPGGNPTSGFASENKPLPGAGLLYPGSSTSYYNPQLPYPLTTVEHISTDYWQLADGSIVSTKRLNQLYTRAKTKGGTPAPPPRPNPTQTNVVTQTGQCRRQIGIFKNLTCSNANAQKHHYPSDFTMGAGSDDRQANVGRFPNMPNYADMPAICLQGGTSSADEHGQIQTAVDYKIGTLQPPSGGKPGTARLGDVIETAINTIAADPRVGLQCRAELERVANQAFAGKDMDQLVRSKKYGMPSTSTTYLSKIPPPTYSNP